MKHKSFAVRLATVLVVCASTMAWSQSLPQMKITTQNNQEPTVTQQPGCWMNCTSTMNYVSMTRFELTGHPTLEVPPTGERDSIRVRGNSTSGVDKKPYRIKFDKEQSLFGKPKAKSWVLLANYYDHTFALNAIAFSLGQRLGLPYTPTSQFVELYINDKYKGIYQLAEQIQVNNARIDINKSEGWLVEFDYHAAETGQIKFTTSKYQLDTRIRSPEVPGCDANPPTNCNVSNPLVSFVRDDINQLTDLMDKNDYSYRSMLNMDSWAKYVLIQQLMDNFDFNSKTQANAVPGSNYAFRDFKDGVALPIVAGPLWDFDLAAGVTAPQGGMGFMGDFPTHFKTYQEPIVPKHNFYKKLWADSVFLTAFKTAWDNHQDDFMAMPTLADSIATVLRSKVKANFDSYPAQSMGRAKPASENDYVQRVSELKTWWNNRLQFFGSEVAKLNITTPPVTSTYTLTVTANPPAGGSVTPTSKSNISSGSLTEITATRNTGYTFQDWTVVSGTAAFTNPSAAQTTVSLSSNATIRANFTLEGGTTPTSGDTIKIEAESRSASSPAASNCPASPPNNQTMCVATNTNTGVTNLGYISSGNSATYTVNVSATEQRTISFRIAANQQTSFTVTVNGQNAGQISIPGTGGWDTYSIVPLSSPVNLNSGNNTIVLNFNGPVNIDYFLLISNTGSPVIHNAANNNPGRSNVMLTKSARGFSAALPANHAYTSYKLIDPRGRIIRSGSVSGASTLKFDNVPKGVLFLNLEGKNAAKKTLRTVTY